MKNEKFLLDIQTKCGDIANEILNAAIDAERTFKCMWPYLFSIYYDADLKLNLNQHVDPHIFWESERKKLCFPLRTSLINLNKSAGNYGLIHI